MSWLAEQNGLTQAELRAYNNLSFLLATAIRERRSRLPRSGSSAVEVGARLWVTLLASNGATSRFAGRRLDDGGSVRRHVGRGGDGLGLAIELESAAAVMAAVRRSGRPVRARIRERPLGCVRSGDRRSRSPTTGARGSDCARVVMRDAITEAMAAAEHVTGYAVTAYPLAMRAAVWSGDPSRAERGGQTAFEALSIHGAAIEATRHGMRSGLATLEGRRQDAVDDAVAGLERWLDIGARFEYALAVIDASVIGGQSQSWLAPHAATARGILEELGARALLDRWDRLAPAGQTPVPGETRSVPAAQHSDAAARP